MLDHAIPPVGALLDISGDEASHALRVKRLESGHRLRLLDGAGVVATGVIAGTRKGGREGLTMEVRIDSRREQPFPGVRPWVDVLTATPKGGRVDEMIDGLSQVGAASWGPLETARGVVDPREHKLARLERIARESAKQCGRSWVLRIAGKSDLATALRGEPNVVTVMADAAGQPWSELEPQHRAASKVRLLIGPEGGWTTQELEQARAAGARVARFGPHIMRIEQAAVAAAAVVMANAVCLDEQSSG